MKVLVYVVCHDDDSRAKAEAAWGAYPWARVTMLPAAPATSVYMESAAFLTVLPDRRHEWQDADYVGVFSWRALQKIDLPPNFLDTLGRQDADVVALMPSLDPMLSTTVNSHPRFLQVWVPALLKLGFSPADATSQDMFAFMCNYWLATPAWMGAYMAFFVHVARVLDTAADTDESLHDALWSDSTYPAKVSTEQLMRVYGKPHMPHHPFIAERMPCFFFWKFRATIAVMPLARPFGYWEGRDVAAKLCARELGKVEEDPPSDEQVEDFIERIRHTELAVQARRFFDDHVSSLQAQLLPSSTAKIILCELC